MTKKNELNIEQIKNLIPHRYPFLLIDKVIDIVPHKSATGIKNVTFNKNFFQGHFETKSVMPGALIIESMAQSAGTLVMFSLKENLDNMSVYLLTVDKAKFRKPVCPGDVLLNKVEKKQNVKSIYKFVCKSYVNNELVAQAEISAILNKDNN